MSQPNPNAPEATNGAIKDPSDWTTGGEPMTGAQESYLHTLARQAGREDEVGDELTKAEASEMIDELREETGKAADPAPSTKAKKAGATSSGGARTRKRST